ncbi:NAD(P)H-quinone oxidoreductase [Labilithrix luteola]|uniref:NAD(P)H-quinone oxidoreductase n=1 Tax=Labilithrix luteola TaxID=1391654 RepID=UPI001F0B54FE|nr:NAD(P)H-quinone oxidoreductase [Labilithrix luteola]
MVRLASMAAMRAAVIVEGAGNRQLELRDVETPNPGPGQVRVRIHATAVNRADLLQVAGHYPAPPDAPADIPGLEIAGEVDAIGPGVLDLSVGERVFGLVGGGAYAEAVVVYARTLAKMPVGLSFTDAAAIPEAFITAYDAVVTQAGLSAGETLLVHAVGSGVGTAAVQIARAIGADAIGTARGEKKLVQAAGIGLRHGIVPKVREDKSPEFASDVRNLTNGRGADVCLELVGGAYVPESIDALAQRGRLMLVGLMAGNRTNLDLGRVLSRRLTVTGTVLRSRPLEEKIAAGQLLARHIAPLVGAGVFTPVVDRVMPLAEVAAAHAYVASNEGFGKVVLSVT